MRGSRRRRSGRPTPEKHPLHDRLAALAEEWDVRLDRARPGIVSLLGFGERNGRRVAIKVVRPRSDEWHGGAVLAAFGGRGVPRVLALEPGAVLYEEMQPGTPLTTLVHAGSDDEACRTLASVIRTMQEPGPASAAVASAEDWGAAFAWYLDAGSAAISPGTVLRARDRYERLCRTQGAERLLHGDLHHDNVLFDRARGWLAFDPKGVRAELEYELGAAFRNPTDALSDFATRAGVERRLRIFAAELVIDPRRVLEWTHAQAVLSAVWSVQDHESVPAATMKLAETARAILDEAD